MGWLGICMSGHAGQCGSHAGGRAMQRRGRPQCRAAAAAAARQASPTAAAAGGRLRVPTGCGRHIATPQHVALQHTNMRAASEHPSHLERAHRLAKLAARRRALQPRRRLVERGGEAGQVCERHRRPPLLLLRGAQSTQSRAVSLAAGRGTYRAAAHTAPRQESSTRGTEAGKQLAAHPVSTKAGPLFTPLQPPARALQPSRPHARTLATPPLLVVRPVAATLSKNLTLRVSLRWTCLGGAGPSRSSAAAAAAAALSPWQVKRCPDRR